MVSKKINVSQWDTTASKSWPKEKWGTPDSLVDYRSLRGDKTYKEYHIFKNTIHAHVYGPINHSID